MKKVLFYTDTPNIGGAEKQMLLLAKYLKKNGYSVDLAYGRYGKIGTMHGDFEKYCENIYILNTAHKHDPRHYFQLKKVLKNDKYDLVHIHLWNPGSCRYAFFAANNIGIPIITTEHDPFKLHGIKKIIKSVCIGKTEQTITISSDNYGLLVDYYKISEKRLSVVHNGIEIDRFLDNKNEVNLPVKTGDIVISCIAELHPRKGHKYLLDAFQKLQKHFSNLQLILVGTGPIEKELKEKYGSCSGIHFLGWRNDIPEILNASDIFVLPSLREAFGLVVLEAMISGTVTIATNNGGTVDIIEDGKSGYLIPPQNRDRIIETVKTVLLNPGQREDIKKAAVERVKNYFTAEKMVEGTIEVYSKITSSFL